MRARARQLEEVIARYGTVGHCSLPLPSGETEILSIWEELSPRTSLQRAESDALRLRRGIRLSTAGFQVGSNAAQQPSSKHRLDQTLLSAQTLCLGQGARIIPRGQDNNRGFCDSRIRPDFAKSPQTIDFGH
jgi:hypothetical protein